MGEKKKGSPTSEEIAEMIDRPPPALKELDSLLFPIIQYFDPHYHHTEKVATDKPTMFVANHSVWSVADMMLPYGLKKHLDLDVRPLGDRMHFAKMVPHRKLFEKLGVVLGSRPILRALMEDQQNILVFPGGAREVLKRHDEKYTLQWKNRVGFVKLALQGGYTITPVGVSGGDDIFDILLDAGHFLETPLGKFLGGTDFVKKYLRGGEELPQIVRGMGFSTLPRPQQFHFVFGEPITLDDYRDRIDDDEAMLEARSLVAEQLLNQIEAAHKFRSKCMKDASWLRQMAANF